jgi:hypothetical protein
MTVHHLPRHRRGHTPDAEKLGAEKLGFDGVAAAVADERVKPAIMGIRHVEPALAAT